MMHPQFRLDVLHERSRELANQIDRVRPHDDSLTPRRRSWAMTCGERDVKALLVRRRAAA